MKRVTFIFLFFCLAITTVLAQVVTTNIATPNTNGLSDNQVDDFDVNTDGTILNNSAADGTAQLGSTAVTANSNITAGSEANLILFQVTGSSGSDLEGTIEVFGTEAGLIIANPNGITCDGCAFINTNRVDLVAGSNYNSSTNTFGSITDANIAVRGGGLDAAEVDVLNIQTGAEFRNSAMIDADNINIAAQNFANIFNTGIVSADSLNFILTDNALTLNKNVFTNFNNLSNLVITTSGSFTNNVAIDLTAGNLAIIANTFTNSANATINLDGNLAITANTFTNSANATINLDGNLAITVNTFRNTGEVIADALTIFLDGDLDYDEGTITTNASNLNVGGDFIYDDLANDFIWGANDNLTVSGRASIDVAVFVNRGNITVINNSLNVASDTFANTGEVVADEFALYVAGDFSNSGTITTNVSNLQVDGDFSYNNSANDFVWATNDSLTVLGSANIVAASFENSGTINVTNNSLNVTANTFPNTGGVLNADTFNLNVAGNFDYMINYLNNGTITTNTLNLNVDNFTYNDDSTNLIWNEFDSLTVLRNANIVAASFNNSGTISANGFDITATDLTNAGTISANGFDITATDFTNAGTISTNGFDITATNFTNAGTISAASANSFFNATVVTFNNDAGAKITAAECDIFNTSYNDLGTITCLDSINTMVFDIARPTNGLSINNYETFHIPINGVVFNNSDNEGDAASIILAQVTGTDISLWIGTLEVVGAEAEVIIVNPNGISCNGCSFINASQVDLETDSSISLVNNGLNASSVGILNIQAGSFTNTSVLQANTFNLFVDDFDNTQKGIINTTIFNLEVGGDFSNNNANRDFFWAERDTLTVLGNANITANNFVNHGNIDVTNSFEITASYTAINQGSIASNSLDVTTDDFFRNLTNGYINARTLNIVAGGKVTNTATIDVDLTLNITANDDSSRTNDRTGFYVANRGNITATTLNIAAVDNFYNRGNITATHFNITRAKDIFFLNKEIDSYDGTYDGGNIFLNGNSSFIADGGIIENYGNIDLGDNILDLTADSFTNHEDSNVTANTLNLAVSSYINDGSIDAVVISDTTIDQ